MKSGLRSAINFQLRQLRQRAAQARKDLRRKVAQMPLIQEQRALSRRRRLLTLLLVALLLLLLSRCPCAEPEGLPALATPVSPTPPPPKPRLHARPTGKLRTVARPELSAHAAPPPDWIDAFRLQVAARGARLGVCFDGAEQPGTLRWSTSVQADSGMVADHRLELVGTGGEVSGSQKDCLLKALSTPAYKLASELPAPSTPVSVSIVIEF